MKFVSLLLALVGWLAIGPTHAAEVDPVDAAIITLSNNWARTRYEVSDATVQATQFEGFAQQAEALAQRNPARAEPLIWEAIIIASEAGARGGLRGLGLARKARDLLEQAERINPNALNGSVYTSLGSLYTQVPGFPIGFGNYAKARTYLERALAINPNGIDPHYFYADYLLRQGDRAGAIAHLERALAAPPRPGREVADRGRRGEVTALLATARGG